MFSKVEPLFTIPRADTLAHVRKFQTLRRLRPPLLMSFFRSSRLVSILALHSSQLHFARQLKFVFQFFYLCIPSYLFPLQQFFFNFQHIQFRCQSFLSQICYFQTISLAFCFNLSSKFNTNQTYSSGFLDFNYGYIFIFILFFSFIVDDNYLTCCFLFPFFPFAPIQSHQAPFYQVIGFVSFCIILLFCMMFPNFEVLQQTVSCFILQICEKYY